MNRLQRYMAAQLLRGFVIVTVALGGLFSVIILVQEIDDLEPGRYTLLDALLFVFLTLPQTIIGLLPVIALLGVSVALGAMNQSRELLVIRSCLSVQEITKTVLVTGAILLLADMALAQWIMPPLARRAYLNKALKTESLPAQETGKQGFYVRHNGLILRVRGIRHGHHLTDVDLLRFDKDGLLQESISATNVLVRQGQPWMLSGAVVRRMQEGVLVRTPRQETLSIPSPLPPGNLGLLLLPTESLPPSRLIAIIRTFRQQHQDPNPYRYALWQQLASPLSIVALLVLAVPLALGAWGRASGGRRLVLGLSLGIGFYVLNKLTIYLGVTMAMGVVLPALLPGSLVLILGLALLRRVG